MPTPTPHKASAVPAATLPEPALLTVASAPLQGSPEANPVVGQTVLYSHFALVDPASGGAHEAILSPAIITRLHPRSTLVDLWVFGPHAIFKANAAPQSLDHGGWRTIAGGDGAGATAPASRPPEGRP